MSASSLLALRASDGATVTLERFPILLGRSVPGGAVPDVDVGHLDPGGAVDNRHLELDRVAQGLQVHDLGGIGGTWVDGRRLPPGGRALLQVGGSLRVAGVTLTLTEAARLPPPPRRPPSAPGWLEGQPSEEVPPPPSAEGSRPEESEPEESGPPAGLDLTGAPLLAREWLERGAELVRVRPGALLETYADGDWSQLGRPLTPAAVDEAVKSVRRVLELSEEVLSGEGQVGDISLEFVLPPLTDRAYLTVRVAPRRPAQLGRDELEEVRRAVLLGGALLVVGAFVEPVLAALAAKFEQSFAGTRVLSFGDSEWWVPAGWPSLDPYHPGAVPEALRTGELFLDQPPEPILESLLGALPRAEGGTVLALRQPSLAGTLEQLARRLDGPVAGGASAAGRRAVAQLFPVALSGRERSWAFQRVAVAPDGAWALAPWGGPEELD